MTVIRNIARDRVLQITAALAVISLFFAKPKLADINFSTLWSILAMMTIIQIFEHLHILDYFAYRLTTKAENTRQLTWLFLGLAVVAGMFLTNDVTVITLVPLYLRIAKKYELPEVLPVTLIGMAANFGSAFTPFGNTHNIFLMNHYQINGLRFFSWSIPLLIASLALLFGFSLFVKKQPIPAVPFRDIRIQARPTVVTCIVALVIFAGVFHVLPSWVGAIAAIILAIALAPKIMCDVDYAIVLTFAGFFVIVSVLQQIPWVVNLVSGLMTSEHSVFLTSIVSSQFISNVPSTVLIGKFTTMSAALFLGSNIGGLGTVIGSMNNLLVYKEYTNFGNHQNGKFFLDFFGLNIIGLIVLTGLGWLILDFVY
ncbi:SLC13 family permease [Lacticaseibacillus parakribbianus]|uniref:SLC13 family permease n=1 Tax=Lacticaseibacillus parakribbianus TaxID=2970927 RepID=UPI0021CB70F0|nr:SLC13 family permease [Lacticaseibacillus parakribbianus]